MKELFIIRHGETDFNRKHLMQGRGVNASLNQRGREQAQFVQNYLSDKSVSLVITSSLNRTVESAQPLIDHLKVQSLSYRELDEMDFGDLEGKDFHSVKQDLIQLQESWISGKTQVPAPGGEDPESVFDRANKKVLEILEESEEGCIAFYLHGRLIRILLSVWLGHGLSNMHEIEHSNGAINHLVWEKGAFKAVTLNIRHHMETEAKE